MSLRGYKKKTKPALWKSMPGYQIDLKKINPDGIADELSRPHTKSEQAAMLAEYKRLGLHAAVNPASGRVELVHGVANRSKFRKLVRKQAFIKQYLGGYMAGSLVNQVKKFQPRIRPVSKRRQAATAEYRAEAEKFIKDAIKAGKTCPVFDAYAFLPPQAQAFLRQPWDGRLRCTKLNEVHHTRGRVGALLNDQRFWLAVSKWGHRLIHAMPALAREHGWMCPEGQWNTPLKEKS